MTLSKHPFAVGLSLLLLVLSACGAPRDAKSRKAQGSGLDYIVLGSTYGLVDKVKKPALNICTKNLGSKEEEWKKNITDVILKWIRPMRAWTTDTLVSTITFEQNSNCDAVVTAYPGVHANTQISSKPVVNMSSSGYFASYNVLLHEFGHAFALGDTYVNGTSGQCARGQPQSVMCNTSFSDLEPDDIAGMKELYADAFPNDKPGDPNVSKGSLNISIPEAARPDGSYELQFAYQKQQGTAGGSFAYCTAGAACESTPSSWLNTTMVSTSGDVEFFKSSATVVVSDKQTIMLRYTLGTVSQYRQVVINAK